MAATGMGQALDLNRTRQRRGPSIENHDAANVGVYVLANFDNNSTYVGCTVDFGRRLRQHNSQLVGGARRTKSSTTWHHRILVTGFSDWKTALSFEWYVKNYRRLDSAADKRLRGVEARRARITALLAKFGTSKFAGLTVTDVPPPPRPGTELKTREENVEAKVEKQVEAELHEQVQKFGQLATCGDEETVIDLT